MGDSEDASAAMDEDVEEVDEESSDYADEASDDADAPIEAASEPAEALAELRAERDELAARIDELETERDELESRLKRTAADFENYKKRQAKRREQEEAAATEDLVSRLLDVRDNLARALDQDADDIEQVREGVTLTLNELDRVLDAEGVAQIEPDPGDPVDPVRHEVMLRVDSDQPAGHIADVYQPGYEMAEKVIRSAQVTVSDGEEE